MKKNAALLALLLFASPVPLRAEPVSVTLYPQGAMVTEEETFRPEKDIDITLPAGADAESLSFTLSTGSVLESRIRTKNTPSPVMKALQKEQENVQNELARVAAERESLSFERLFWADPPLNLKAGDRKGLEKQAALSAEQLNSLAEKDIALSGRERKLEKQNRELESRMEAVGPHNKAVQSCSLVLRDATPGPVTVRWTYFLPGASWQPRYRVLAEEKTGKARVFMEAVLRQDSGADWKNVNVTLASVEDMRRVIPPSLPDWIVGEKQPVMRSMNLMAAKAMDSETAVQELATGISWKLGTMNVPAEGQVTRFVAAHDLDASFYRLVRPLQDTRAWFTASLTSGEVPLLPAGQAVFYVNGTENARGTFRLSAGQKELFFGVDQLVGVRTDALPTGESAEGTETQVWKRSVDITSSHDSPVAVRVEIAAPILRNSAMRLTEESTPKAVLEEKGSCYVWLLDIPAGKSAHILQNVTVTLPKDRRTDDPQAS